MTPAARGYPELARAIAARREALGLSQDQLERAADLPPAYVRRLEAGAAVLKPATLAPLLSVLGLRLIVQPASAA